MEIPMDSCRISSLLTAGGFPDGVRVLVVDNDAAYLRVVEKMLKKCNYEVTSTSSEEEALKMLEERKDWFQVVMCDVKDGFKFVEHVHKLNFPVIMMCGDGETSKVMTSVVAGACDYLVKPLRLKEVKNIWQHVLRKKVNLHGRNGLDQIRTLIDQQPRRSRENESESSSSGTVKVKKPRVVWTHELNQKFIEAVNRIGLDNAGPKKIREMMGDTGLTRENIASHLQKYRLSLSRQSLSRQAAAELAGTGTGTETKRAVTNNIQQQNIQQNNMFQIVNHQQLQPHFYPSQPPRLNPYFQPQHYPYQQPHSGPDQIQLDHHVVSNTPPASMQHGMTNMEGQLVVMEDNKPGPYPNPNPNPNPDPDPGLFSDHDYDCSDYICWADFFHPPNSPLPPPPPLPKLSDMESFTYIQHQSRSRSRISTLI